MSGADLLAASGPLPSVCGNNEAKGGRFAALRPPKGATEMGFYTDVFFGLDCEHRAMDVTLSEAGVDVGRPKPEGAQCSEASKGGQKCVRA